MRNNIGFGLRMAGVDRAERDRKVEEAAALLNLTEYLDRRPAALSGGQRQRVAIGRAIVRQPKAFLFDEPLSNLDAALRVNMRLEIARLQKSLATTAIYVTHDQVEAMTMADKIVVLNAGGIEQVGHAARALRAPDNLFVAGFIGSPKMNFVAGDTARKLAVRQSGSARSTSTCRDRAATGRARSKWPNISVPIRSSISLSMASGGSPRGRPANTR